ncbi:MAG: hypothetical protein QW265_01145 [Candidatus Bathyarchaeia archaeon]
MNKEPQSTHCGGRGLAGVGRGSSSLAILASSVIVYSMVFYGNGLSEQNLS